MATPEVLTGEDAGDGADEEAEKGSDAEEQGAQQGADKASYGTADRAPVARPEPSRTIGREEQIRNEGEEGEEPEKDQHEGAYDLEARHVGVDEDRGKDQRNARQTRQNAAQKAEEHDQERDPEDGLVRGLHEGYPTTGSVFLAFLPGGPRTAFKEPDLYPSRSSVT